MQIFLTLISTCFYCFCPHCLTIKLNISYFDNGLFVLKYQESCQNIHKKRTVLTCHHNLLLTMASNGDDSTPNCVDKMEFLSALDSLKEQQKSSKSEITLFVDDNFYERATTYLVAKENKNSDEIEKIMTKSDFQNLPCTCRNPHKWVINLIDHHTKFVNSHSLHAKSADEVLDAVKNYCLSYGYPKKILTDNGGEFCNAKLKLFCEENQIKLSHRAPRSPTTQGLVERSNRTWKENMRAIIMG